MSVVRLAVRTLGELSITLGVLLLLFLGWQLFWTDVVADRAQQATADALTQQWAADLPPSQTDDPAPGAPAPADEAAGPDAEAVLANLPGQAIALLRVPAFGEDYVRPVLAGTDGEVLKEGIGHYDGTAMPGEVGNFAVAGHRTTYGAPFNPIEELSVGDPVVVETAQEYFVYRVQSSSVVLPSQVGVIAPVPDRPGETPTTALLTMTTCHPMFSARERYIVHAVLESTTPRAEGPPAVLAAAGVG